MGVWDGKCVSGVFWVVSGCLVWLGVVSGFGGCLGWLVGVLGVWDGKWVFGTVWDGKWVFWVFGMVSGYLWVFGMVSVCLGW